MPILEYACSGCGARFEALVARTAEPSPPCPRCGAGQARRLWSTFAVTHPSAERSPGPCGSDDCACRRSA
jgi:putative FmdB family regulatory protein